MIEVCLVFSTFLMFILFIYLYSLKIDLTKKTKECENFKNIAYNFSRRMYNKKRARITPSIINGKCVYNLEVERLYYTDEDDDIQESWKTIESGITLAEANKLASGYTLVDYHGV